MISIQFISPALHCYVIKPSADFQLVEYSGGLYVKQRLLNNKRKGVNREITPITLLTGLFSTEPQRNQKTMRSNRSTRDRYGCGQADRHIGGKSNPGATGRRTT